MGKRRVIAETGAGQHGVATATACAHFGLRVRRLHGRGRHSPPAAQRVQHEAAGGRGAAGHQRLADAARRDQRGHARLDEQRRNDALHPRLGRRAASVSRGSSAIFSRSSAARRSSNRLEQTRPAARRGRGLRRRRQQRGRHVLSVRRATRASSWSASRPAAAPTKPGDHAATLSFGRPGVLHGSFSYVMQDDDGQTCDVHSFRPASTIPASARSTAIGKTPAACATPTAATTKPSPRSTPWPGCEGILPALESSHAVAEAMEIAAARKPDEAIVVCLSGRGDKDAAEIARLRGLEF